MNIKDKRIIPLVILSVFGIVMLIVATSKYGPGVTHDSVAYLFAAKELMEGRDLVYFGYGTPFVQWPPMFPALIALLGGLGIDLIEAACLINSVAFGLIIFLSSLWMLRNMRSYIVVILGSCAILFSVPLFQVSKYAWSEPLFILFITLFLITLYKYLKEYRYIFLVVSAGFASLACLTRYMGTAAVFTAVLLLLAQKKGIKNKIIDILIFGLISTLPLAVWLLRNYLVFSTFAGSRTPSQLTPIHNVGLVLGTIASWFLPFDKVPIGLASLIVFIILVALIIGIIKVVRSMDTGIKVYEEIIPAVVAFTFSAVYTIYLVIAASTAAFDPIGDRLLSPVFVPLVLLVFFTIDKIYRWIYKDAGKKLLAFLIIVLICVGLANPVKTVYHLTKASLLSGAGGYNTDAWKGSDLIGYIDELPSNCKLYSNNPDAIYILTGKHAQYLPKKHTEVYEYGFDRFKKAISVDQCSYIVWFYKGAGDWLYNIEKLGQYFTIERLVQAEDGEIYIIK